jgi:hypothetical protein
MNSSNNLEGELRMFLSEAQPNSQSSTSSFPASNLIFDGTLDEVFGGVNDYIPDVRIGFHEIEVGIPHHVYARVSERSYPKRRKKGAVVALYTALYVLPEGTDTRLHIKLGSHSLYFYTAGLIWSQAPLYAKIIGVFVIDEERHTEYLEKRCEKYIEKSLAKLVGEEYKEKVTVNTLTPKIEHIINMWRNAEKFKERIEEYMSIVNRIAERCFNRISKDAEKLKVRVLYGSSDMWFTLPMHPLRINEGYVSGLQELSKVIRGGDIIGGELTVLPNGLCMFKAPIKSFISNGEAIYIDRCRVFHYTLSFSLVGV